LSCLAVIRAKLNPRLTSLLTYNGLDSGLLRKNPRNKQLFSDITVQDAKWLAGWLGRLSDEQIRDAFRAANYTPEEVEQLASAVRERIEALANISTNVAAK
jgi:hypothetical protein